jgi:hypothetical protein
MDLSEMVNSVTLFFKDNPIIAVAVGLLLLFLLIRKPKLFLVLFCLVLLLAAALYLIMDVASIGKTGKEKIIQKGLQPDMDDRH